MAGVDMAKQLIVYAVFCYAAFLGLNGFLHIYNSVPKLELEDKGLIVLVMTWFIVLVHKTTSKFTNLPIFPALGVAEDRINFWVGVVLWLIQRKLAQLAALTLLHLK